MTHRTRGGAPRHVSTDAGPQPPGPTRSGESGAFRPAPVSVGYDIATERELFLLELDRLDQLPRTLRLPTRHFACLLVLDGRTAQASELHRGAANLLGEGAAYLSVWGPGCGRVRGLLDDAVLFAETEATEDSIVLTEDHAGESLEDTLVGFLERSQPATRYLDSCRGALVVTVNAPGWALACREALSDPRGFVAGMALVRG